MVVMEQHYGRTPLRVIFAGRDNAFNRGFCVWLRENFELAACLFLEGERFSLKGRWSRISWRGKKYGWWRVLDELAFHVYDRLILRRGEKKYWDAAIPEQYRVMHTLDVPCYVVDNVHGKKWIEMVTSLKPDVIIGLCGSVIFKPKFYTIPKFGTFILHEGLTPEYRGLHTPLWALVKDEPQYIGYTLLKVNKSIDGGDVLVQGGYMPEAGEGLSSWSLVGHKAIISGLPQMAESLRKLIENGGFTAVSLEGRNSNYYSWMTLTKYTRWRYRRIFKTSARHQISRQSNR